MENKKTKKIAICYWGLLRSLKKTVGSHKRRIFKFLENEDYEYDIFMHTWKLEDKYQYVWTKKVDIPINYDDYKLLNPDYYKIDNQNEFIDNLDFSKYFYEDQWTGKPGNEHKGEWVPQLLRNHLCALESLKRVYKMVEDTNKEYDYIICVRPDACFREDVNFTKLTFEEDNNIYIANFGNFCGYNDRFALGKMEIMKYYMCRIDEAEYFRKKYHRIDAESFCKYIINKYCKVKILEMNFGLIRPS